MAFDGVTMTVQDQAQRQAAKTRELMQGLERRIAWGIRKADEQGATDVSAALFVCALLAKSLHKALAFAAELIAARFGENHTVYSGGDDKPEPTPEGP